MRVLVTGASGFLGQYVVEQSIARGDQVRAYCRQPSPELQRAGADLYQGDLSQLGSLVKACEGIELVYHVAGVAGIWGPWDHYYSANTVGTFNVIQACQAAGVAKLVYTSSPSVTFSGQPQCGIDESTPYPTRWLCHYPHTKALAEQAVLNANDGRSFLSCALRPHLIWGPRDRHLIPRVLDRARCGQLRQIGGGANLIDMIYVDNAAEAHLQAADSLSPGSPVCGNAYFLSNGEPVNCWQWLNAILKLAHLPPVRRRVPFRLAWVIGHMLELVYHLFSISSEPRMTRFLAAQLAQSHYFNINRARRDFHYVPRVGYSEGMARLEAWVHSSNR